MISSWRAIGLSLVVGVVMALGLAPLFLWPLTLLGLAGTGFLFAATPTARRAALIGWALGTGYFAFGLSWIVEPFFVEPELYGWMAPFALLLLAAGLALFWAAAFGLARALGGSRGQRILALVLFWSLAEFARAYILTGFPWGALAQIWLNTPVAALLAWVGPHGVAMLTLIAGLAPAIATRRIQVALGSVPAFAVAGLAFWAQNAQPDVQGTGKIVRLVQPNAPQDKKWHPDFAHIYVERQIELTGARPVENGREGDDTPPDLVLWPESALPYLLNYAGPTLTRAAEAAGQSDVALGIVREDQGRYYNALIRLDADGQVIDTYDKHHLVPFGEYMPMAGVFRRLGIQALAQRVDAGYTPGPGPRLMDFGALGNGLPLICYEAVFPQHARSAEGRADFIVQVTNDAWFGARSGPYQHLAQARMRAIEQGLPLMRAANTGISAMISPDGTVTDRLPLNQAGYVDAHLWRPFPETPYGKNGDMPLFMVLLATFSLLLLAQRVFHH